ncbi:MAG: hypothetical protein KAH93_01495, partial [Candidatus Aenigmarchaeota archaeon]|nr:hypothetical protein [Candidatus Aenigmarchaeota archaeon]
MSDKCEIKVDDSLKQKKEPMAVGDFLDSRVVVWDKGQAEAIYAEKFFGKWIDVEDVSCLQLSLEDSMLLVERGFLDV